MIRPWRKEDREEKRRTSKRKANAFSAAAEVQRGVAFLVASQRPDGSWPTKSRAQPGEKPFTNPVPITYFGSAWATLGLVRSAGKPVNP